VGYNNYNNRVFIVTDYDRVADKVNELTQGKMADVVLNSLGIQTWENSFASVGLNGRWVTFGGLTGADVKLNVQSLYSKQIRLIGSTGGNRKEFTELIDMSKELKTRVWKKFPLDEAKEALQALFAQGKRWQDSYQRKIDSHITAFLHLYTGSWIGKCVKPGYAEKQPLYNLHVT